MSNKEDILKRYRENVKVKYDMPSLDDIKGIGPKTRDELLKAFKSVKRLREAPLEQLSEAVGPAKAAIVYNYFHALNG